MNVELLRERTQPPNGFPLFGMHETATASTSLENVKKLILRIRFDDTHRRLCMSVCARLKSFRIHKHNAVQHIVFIVISCTKMEHRINGFCIYIEPDGFGTKNTATTTRRTEDEEEEEEKTNQTIRKFHFPFVDSRLLYACVPLLRVHCGCECLQT